jgi:ATP-dependent helicase HrpB
VRRLDDVEAIVVLDTMALSGGALDTRILATAAMPVPPSWLAAAGLGRLEIGEVTVEREAGRPVRLSSVVQRVHAGKVIDEREEVPRGGLARGAIAQLVRDGRLFPEVRREAKARLARAALAAALGQQAGRWLDARSQAEALWPEGVPSLEAWLASRVSELGVESGEDLALLEPTDLLPPDLPEHLRAQLDKTFPRRLDLPDATYEVEVRPGRRWVILEKVRGSRRVPPPVSFLPRFEGFAIKIRHKGTLVTLRDERGRVVGTSVT